MILSIADMIRSRWQAMGFSCELWIDPPGKRWENFIHPTDELVYVLEGVIELEWQDKKKVLRPGDEALIPANVVHAHRNIGGTIAHWFYGKMSQSSPQSKKL